MSADTPSGSIEGLARQLVSRIESVYNLDYVQKVAQEEPESMLGLVMRLKEKLNGGMSDA